MAAAGHPHTANADSRDEARRLPGVALSQGARVGVIAGDHAGDAGRIASLWMYAPDPVYLVELERVGSHEVIPQSCLDATG